MLVTRQIYISCHPFFISLLIWHLPTDTFEVDILDKHNCDFVVHGDDISLNVCSPKLDVLAL